MISSFPFATYPIPTTLSLPALKINTTTSSTIITTEVVFLTSSTTVPKPQEREKKENIYIEINMGF